MSSGIRQYALKEAGTGVYTVVPALVAAIFAKH